MWDQAKKLLNDKLPESVYSLWIDPIQCLHEDDTTLELAGPDRFFCNWVTENYLATIQESLVSLGKREITVHFQVSRTGDQTPRLLPAGNKEQLRLPAMPPGRSCMRTLHPRYTFAEFVVGESNFLPHSACEAMARSDFSLGHCLYVEAGTGLGKSHLTHAVAHYILNQSPGTRLHYLTAQQFTGELVNGIRKNTMDQFKEKYHNQCDVLLVEDVHAFAGKARTQEEVGGVLDLLMDRGKLIIFTGMVAPKDIPDIDPAFRSRLSAGLVTTINPPDLRTRIMIIRRKAENSGLALSEELVEYLAQHIRGDIRQVESAMVGLKAASCMRRKAPDLSMVREVVAGIINRAQALSAEVIRDFVAREFRTKVLEMQSPSRKKVVAFPRQIAMFLARKLTDQGLADIGSAFNRDHSTVVHSVRVITEAMARNASVRGQVEHLTEKLKKQYS